MSRRVSFVFLAFALSLLGGAATFPDADAPALLTVAERSDFKAGSRHAEVLDFCRELAKRSPLVRLSDMGTSVEGRKLPLVIVADPPVASPEEAAKSGKLVVFAMGNIHAGEIDGKEALLMLARDLALAKDRPLLKNLVLVFAPNVNADGNDKMAKTNRPHQAGPDEVGLRANAQGFDLNRDFVKLESPEIRGLVRAIRRWDAALLIDTHTTNGSYHRYTLTYDGPRHAAADAQIVATVRDTLLPDVGRRFEKRAGYKSYFYGNFSRDRSLWETYPALPRYSIQYVGLRNRIGILSESYVYAPYRDRVLATRDFVRSCFEYVAEHKDTIGKLVKDADRSAQECKTIALRQKATALPGGVPILGFVEETKDGKRIVTKKPREYQVAFVGRSEPTLSVARPYAYLFPAKLSNVVENLQRHGINVEELREDIELDVEAYRIDKIAHAKLFQKHSLVSLDVTPRTMSRRFPAGTILVRTTQPLGTLASLLLEPQSEDGLATWNFFDAVLKEGHDYPVLRLVKKVPMNVGRARPLPEDRPAKTPITYEMFEDGTLPSLSGYPVSGLVWLDDGEHFLQTKEGERLKVHAATGRSEPYVESPDPAVEAGEEPKKAAPQKKAIKELVTTSPNKKTIAFVRAGNLYVEDIETKKERALTSDGSDVIFNGKADWVYFEELFHRKWQAYWWSPDSSHLAFLRFDDRGVPKATVVNYTGIRQVVELTPYPRAGEPNPKVKLGIAPVANGPIRWADLSDYDTADVLISRVGFLPGGKTVYLYVQNRIQTWLDFCVVSQEGGKPTRLFRDATKAWIEDPGPPVFLEDGSFLLTSERSGYKHIYQFAKDGALKGAVTKGEWEARVLQRVDEKAGWVYFIGTKDSPTASNFYKVKLDGTGLEKLTKDKGSHQVSLNSKATMFIDTQSSDDAPTQVRLFRTDGTLVRTLDTNPVYRLEEIKFAKYERVQIKTPDGFLLEASLHRPANFDPKKKYPVWFMTYAGPHAPTIRDGGKGAIDDARANLGFIIFRCDPRSASGKGAVSTWTAYKQLGVQELKDIETAIGWLSAHPYVDEKRIGMSGHSYGGFMTAYAMTHSKLFAAGIAGAPVTDWRNYDTIYTERYMDTPQNNPKGYEVTSVVKAAKNLHGRLLISHGVIDDNVHVQNTLQLVHALQQANKDFEVMLYPTARHGITGRHYQRLMTDFMKRTLKPEP